MKKKWLLAPILLLLLALTGIMGLRLRFPLRYVDLVQQHAGDIHPSWILAVIMAESSFRPTAQSHAGAQGLMQLMPTTAAWVAELMQYENFDPQMTWQPATNIALGSFYLNRLKAEFNGNLQTALAAYNAGQGNVARWLSDPALSPDGTTLSHIPFPETAHYLRRVNTNQRIYRWLLRLPTWAKGVLG